MKKLALFLLCITALTALHARSAMDFFLTAPQTVMAYADSASRLDMRDYYESGVKKAVTARMGAVTLDSVAERILHMRLDSVGEVTVAVVPVKNDTVIAVIETVRTPLPVSRVHFYNKDWSERRRQPEMPDAYDFGATTYPQLFFMSMEYDPEGNVFRAVNHTSERYRPSELPDNIAEMKKELTLRYDGKKFKALK